MFTSYNLYGVIILSYLENLKYMSVFVLFHYTRLESKREEKNKTLYKKAVLMPLSNLHIKAISLRFNRWIVL